MAPVREVSLPAQQRDRLLEVLVRRQRVGVLLLLLDAPPVDRVVVGLVDEDPLGRDPHSLRVDLLRGDPDDPHKRGELAEHLEKLRAREVRKHHALHHARRHAVPLRGNLQASP